MDIITYLRVSTDKQGHSGLGLEAQKATIARFVTERQANVIGTYEEIESGKRNDRPELGKAMHQAQITGATLVIAKLDRLSRNAAFLLNLRDSGVDFIAADMPEANKLTVGIMALVAEQEREAISKRTKEALAAAKARGVKLGNPNGSEALRRAKKGNTASLQAQQAKAEGHALKLVPVIEELQDQGITSLGAISAALNERRVLTPRGKTWHKSSVRNLLTRIDGLGR